MNYSTIYDLVPGLDAHVEGKTKALENRMDTKKEFLDFHENGAKMPHIRSKRLGQYDDLLCNQDLK